MSLKLTKVNRSTNRIMCGLRFSDVVAPAITAVIVTGSIKIIPEENLTAGAVKNQNASEIIGIAMKANCRQFNGRLFFQRTAISIKANPLKKDNVIGYRNSCIATFLALSQESNHAQLAKVSLTGLLGLRAHA